MSERDVEIRLDELEAAVRRFETFLFEIDDAVSRARLYPPDGIGDEEEL